MLTLWSLLREYKILARTRGLTTLRQITQGGYFHRKVMHVIWKVALELHWKSISTPSEAGPKTHTLDSFSSVVDGTEMTLTASLDPEDQLVMTHLTNVQRERVEIARFWWMIYQVYWTNTDGKKAEQTAQWGPVGCRYQCELISLRRDSTREPNLDNKLN